MKRQAVFSSVCGSRKWGVAALAFGLCVSSAFAANTWWVAKEDPNASDANAGTEAAPFRTIQAALDNPSFAAGDTVKVKRGVYDEGASISDATAVSNRVLITKACHLVGVEGAEVTHIVGARSPGSTVSGGRGHYATRCIFVGSAARTADMVIEGFTLRNGVSGDARSSDNKVSDTLENHGGAIYSVGTYPLVIDCVISNCAAYKGAALRGGTAVRCYIADNLSVSSGVALNGAYGYSCIIAYNSGGETLSSSYLCNCTLFCNSSSTVLTGNGGAYNCIFVDNGSPLASTKYTDANTLGSVFTATNGMGVTWVDRWQVVGPAAGDWRVVAGSVAETVGSGIHANRSAFTHIPSSERYKDFYKNPIPETGTVMAGAVQQSAQVVAGGIAFNSSGVTGMAVDGHPVHPKDWVLATAYPTQFVVTATAGTVFRYIRRMPGGWEPVVPRMDESALLMPPPTIGQLSTNDVQYANHELWIDPNTGDDANPGTAEAPFKTLQKGFYEAQASNYAYTVVHAAAGDYTEGGEPIGRYQSSAYALTNRLCIGTGLSMRFKGAGVGQSIIWGARDESKATGIGDAAIGCVAAYSADAIVQGFTLTNGYTRSLADSRGNGNIAYGRPGDRFPVLADCVIAGGRASNAAIGYTRCVRCVFTGVTTEGTLTENGTFLSCLFYDNTLTDVSRSSVCGDYCSFCTYVGAPNVIPFGNYVWVVGSVIDTGDFIRTLTKPRASMAENLRALSGVAGVMSDVTAFVDPANGDFRVKSYSGAVRCTPMIAGDTDWGAFAWRHAVGDVAGRPLQGTPSGGLLAGAVQEVVSAANMVGIKASYGGIGDGESVYVSGERTITEPIAVTRAAGTRPCIGFVVDGVTNLFAETTLPVSVAPSETGSSVVALYTTDWYVDSENGDDAKDGFTSDFAKRTLAAILTVNGLASGDTVHAAPGTYDAGVMTYTLEQPMRSRAIVPAGVTLLGDAGAAATIITGTAATESAAGMYGCGSEAVRCVALHNNASLTGFTLTGGHTDCIGNGTDAGKSNMNNLGGGVTAIGASSGDASTRRVTECVISNNVAYRGGGAQRVSLRRCRVIGNRGLDGTGNGSGTLYCEHYGCVVAGQLANYSVFYPSAFCDSTVYHANNSERALYIIDNTCTLRNSIICGNLHIGGGKTVARYTFIATASSGTPASVLDASTKVVGYDALQLDEDYRPIIGANAAIDGANPVYAYTASTTKSADGTLLDISGVQRIYNGQLDAGALEADWRPAYARLLGGQGLTVLTASPEVVTGAVASVCIPTGTVTMAWANIRAPRPVRQTYGLEVTGTGTLTVTVDGETATYTSADGALKLTRKTTAANTDMVFAYEPGADDTGCAILFGFERYSGTTLCFR